MIDLKHAHTLPHPFVEADVKFLGDHRLVLDVYFSN